MAMVCNILVAAILLASTNAAVYFEELFDSNPFSDGKWIVSSWKGEDMGAFDWTSGNWHTDSLKDMGLQTTGNSKHHVISTKMAETVSNRDKPLVVQFTVKHERKEYSFCGGGYIKLLQRGLNQEQFGGDDPYAIMFGPDICGYDIHRIHAIFTDKAGTQLLKKDEIKIDHSDKNEYTHLYTLVLRPDHTYQVLLDLQEKASGNIAQDWAFPPKEHDDPNDIKPADWVDDAQMADPTDIKPEEWDERETVMAPHASKPTEWDDEMDGAWEAPIIQNPSYKGLWQPRLIPNPAYQGVWKARQVPNPGYYEDVATYDDLAFVGFELWTVNNGTIFDNILVTDDVAYAMQQGEALWKVTSEGERKAKEMWERAKQAAREGPKVGGPKLLATPVQAKLKEEL